jgi:pimeloyl-ACP methyl ester carboxylesterase
MPFPYLGETQELNKSTRSGVEGSFAALTDGITHYQMAGDENGNPVVLTHGFSVPYYIFDGTFEFLCNSGFRVLRYDLFGRGFSDRPRLKYDIHLFVRQLTDLLDALHFGPVDLVGLSMGGPITTAFLTQYPERVRRQVLIDPAGAKAIQLSFILKGAKFPSIGEVTFGLFGSEGLVRSMASDFFDPAMIEEFQARYRIQMQFKGFMRAILSSIRNGMLDSFYVTYQLAGKLGKPTLLFWGRDDRTVPFDHSAEILKAIPHAEFHAIDDCGHLPHFEKPEIVHPILKRFLEANGAS